jgi:SAM-dependent methyltransferase
MADKHAPLADAEIAASLSAVLSQAVTRLPADARVLDWGCGRGRAVLHLRDAGIAAWGVDLDSQVLARADAALARRGLSDAGVLRELAGVEDFSDGYFDLVFSEETLEHVSDLAALTAGTFRLTAPGGIGLHSFPGMSRWLEPHLRIPFIHWWPDGAVRRAWLHASLFLGAGPRPPWPETLTADDRPLPLAGRAQVYARYLRDKVHYRPIEEIVGVFRDEGFEVACRTIPFPPRWIRLFPSSWRRNGFPAGNLVLELRKPD